MTANVRALIAESTAVLFDFDGPTCDVFSTITAQHVAAVLKALISDAGIPLPITVAQERDPLAVLQYSAKLGERMTRAVDDALRAAEMDAVQYSTPTPGAHESIRRCAESGRKVGFVSNNSADAIERYLQANDLARHTSVVVGRAYANPTLMKPNPVPVQRALTALSLQPADVLLIGDSTTDVEVCQATQVACIGYVNKPGKEIALTGAHALITDMAEIATALA